jgi:hypothetical protein
MPTQNYQRTLTHSLPKLVDVVTVDTESGLIVAQWQYYRNGNGRITQTADLVGRPFAEVSKHYRYQHAGENPGA